MRGPVYGLDAHAGLHVLKDAWTQRSFLRPQCEELVRTLDDAIDATMRAAPLRKREKLHFEHRSKRVEVERMDESSDEPRLEAALLAAFETAAPSSISDLWTRIVTKQYALFAQRKKAGWGHVDLLGVVQDQPVVIELKNATSAEPPLRPLIEAASYAIALRKNWEAFSEAFAAVHGSVSTVSEPIRLVILAPPSYWALWAGPQPWKAAYQTLVEALATRGYPARFAAVRAELRGRVYASASLHVEEIAFP